MNTKDPANLLNELGDNMIKIRSSVPLGPKERDQISNNLSEVYNYLALSLKKPSFAQALYATRAHDEAIKDLQTKEHAILEENKAFVKEIFAKADQYLTTIQLGGYAVFFTVWTFTRQSFDQMWGILAGILMVVSATFFVGWEVWKSTLLALSVKRHASISSGGLEEFLRTRFPTILKERSALFFLAKSRATMWILCVSTALPAIVILLWQLVSILWLEMWQ